MKIAVLILAVITGFVTPAQAGAPILVMADGPSGVEKGGSGVAQIVGTEWYETPVVQNGLTVNVYFKDPDGTGFRDAALGEMRRARLYDTLRYVADTLNAPGELNMMVGPSESDGTGALAQGGPMFVAADGLTQGNVFLRLSTGTVPFAGWAEMVLTFDWGYKWHLGTDAPPSDAVDLRSVLVHEITHCLGFISLMASDGASRFSPDITTYTVFDSMLATKPLLNRLLGGTASSPLFQGATADLTGGAVVFVGTAATAAFGDTPPIYSSTPFLTGTSLQHWVEDAMPCKAVMEPRYAYGVARRLYTAVDIAVLRDIGWTAAKMAGQDPCAVQTVTVPNVVDQTQAAAGTLLTGAGLQVGAITQAYSATVPSGNVMAQDPAAGSLVAPNTAVALTMSKGPQPVIVPDVVGQTQTAAFTAINSANLTVGAITQDLSTTVASGSVISQSPTAGTAVSPGTAVALTVSKGPQPVIVPDVVGKTQTAAATAITAAGLTVGVITQEYSSTVASGVVISQSPASGTSANPGTAVAMTVSKGPEVPNVVGETQAAASAAITAAGLTVGAITQECSDTITPGCVIIQSPAAGAQGVVSGNAMALVICTGRCNSATEETVLLPGDVPLVMVWIPGGTFMMGRYPGEQDGDPSESPQHTVTLGGYWMAKYALTKRQWTAVTGTTPWSGQSYVLDDLDSPAVYVLWNDTQSFLTTMNSFTGKTFRLPSESEREYACRGGTTTRFYWGDDPGYTAIGDYAWYDGNAGSAGQQYAHVVGLKLPNAFGLYDMSGNVWEWCEDDWHNSYTGAPTGGQAWVDSPRSFSRAFRGGAWYYRGDQCRSVSRGSGVPGGGSASYYLGVRLARTADPVTVPDVVGQTQAAAGIALTGAGLNVGAVTQECSATVSAGLVISQNPAANTSATYGSNVALVVSTGPCPPVAPVVTAVTDITSSGFTAHWNAVTGATGYRLDVSTTDLFSSFVSGYTDLDLGAVTSRAVSGLNAGATYYYRVRAYNDGGASDNSITVTVNTASPSTYTFTSAVEGSGSVTPASGTTYTAGTPIVVTANPALNWTFDHWEGDLVGVVDNPASLQMNGNRSVTAVFRLSGARTLQGTITNSLTGNPVQGVYVEVSASLGKALAHATTDADGRYSMQVSEDTGAVTFTFTCPEYMAQTKDFTSPPLAAVYVALVPVGVHTPRQPIAISGPHSVYLEWYTNPEYSLKGYYVWRVTTDAAGTPLGAAAKIDGLMTGTEYSDTSAVKGVYYKYQIQALSGADRPSSLSPSSEPTVLADNVTLFTTDQDVPDSLANLYLWDFTPADVTDNAWVRIPISARSAYDVTTLGMGIPIDLPTDLLNVTPADAAAGNIRVEPTGITAGMAMLTSVNEDGKLVISADDMTDWHNLYGSGVLFDVFVQKKNVTGSGKLQLVEDTFNPGPPPSGRQGVHLYGTENPPYPIDLLLESGTLFTTKGTCPLHGDVDGDGKIDANDVAMMRQLYLGNVPSGDCILKTADMNLDRRVDQADMIQLSRWLSGLSINPPQAAKSAEGPLGFALMDTKAFHQPEVWVTKLSNNAAANSTVTATITISGSAPLAGFSATVNFLAGLQGLTFTSAALASGMPVSFAIASKDNTSENHGSVTIVANGTAPTAKSTDTQLVQLSFLVGSIHQPNGELPVNLGSFEVTDQYGYTPRHGAPGEPTIVKDNTPDTTVTVPNVVGQTQAAATTAITGAGLTVTITQAFSATVPSGSVISQNPPAGTLVDQDSDVTLTVSKGSEPVSVPVPNVVGTTQAAATTAIVNAGLTMGTVTEAYSASVASGTVISQDPTAGTSVATGTAVALIVSKGPEPVSVPVPNVVGQTQAAATTAIVSAGLTMGTVTEAYSASVASGTVISQDPTAGTSVATGTAVALVVSKGPESVSVTVPNVVGQTQQAAGTTLTGANLSTGTVTQQCSNSVALGLVISQNPAANQQAASGSAVALVVSTGPCAPSAPTTSAATDVSATGFTAHWSSVSGAAGYRLDVSTTGLFSSFVAGHENLDVATDTSRALSGLNADTRYYYRVRAYNPYGTSGNSDTSTVKTSTSQTTYTFTSSVKGGGSVTPASGTTHSPGTPLVVTAKPALNWTFDHWEGDLEGVTANPAGLSMTQNRNVIAVFRLGGPRTLQGTVTNSLTKNPLPGVYVEVSKALSKAIAHATTDADGRYSMTVAEDTTSVTFTFSCPEYLPQTKTFTSPPTDPVDLALVPVGVTTPKGPMAYSGPRSVFVEWAANPEYNLKGYYLWRVATDASGTPSGSAEKVGGLLTTTEFTDSGTTPGTHYKYQVQALSGADRSSELSPASDPVKAQFLTLFTPKIFVDNTLASLYLWDFTPTDASDNKWVRIPLSARSAYEVSSSQMQIVVDLPTTLLDVTAAADIRVETSGITSGMNITHTVPSTGELSITANSADGAARSLYGSGVLFDVYVPKKSSGSCGDMTLVPGTSGGGVRLFDDGNPPKTIPLDLENDQLCITGGDCLHGDVNGDKRIDAQDVQRIREVYVGRITPDDCAKWAGDINLDGRVDSADAIQLQRWLAGVPINPPAAGTKEAAEVLSFATLGDKAVPRPEVWIGEASGAAASMITVPVTIRNAAALAGFTMTVNFYAGLQGLTFRSAALGGGLPAAVWGISSMDNTAEDHGSVVIAANGSESVGTYGDTQLVLLSFTVGASVQSGAVLPLSLAAFDGNDSYAVTPRHEAPGQAEIVDTPKSPITEASVPNVINQTEAAAGTLLHTAGLTTGAATRQCSDAVAAGLVLSQNPVAGVSVVSGTAVALVVSTGPCSAEGENTVPTEAELRARLATDFDAVDANADGTVSFAEALAALPGLTQAVFNAVNVSGTGQITRGEVGLEEPGGCSCSKGAYTADTVKDFFSTLFLGGLGLIVLLVFSKRQP